MYATPSSLSERKSEALTTAISTLKVGDHRWLCCKNAGVLVNSALFQLQRSPP
jgi:hypothetical protein